MEKPQHQYFFVNEDPIETMEAIRDQRPDIVEARKIEDEVERGATLFCEEELLYHGEVESLINKLELSIEYEPSEYRRIQLFSGNGSCRVYLNKGDSELLEPHYSLIMSGGGLENRNPQLEIAMAYLNKHVPSLTIAHYSLKEIVTESYQRCEEDLSGFLAGLK